MRGLDSCGGPPVAAPRPLPGPYAGAGGAPRSGLGRTRVDANAPPPPRANTFPSLDARRQGRRLLEDPLWNRGTAFTQAERRALGLVGLLPPHVETLDQQAARAYEGLRQRHVPLERYVALRAIQDSNETLFYRLLQEHLEELLPFIYTPTVGEACQRYAGLPLRPRGVVIAYPDRDAIDAALAAVGPRDVQVLVVTDGERILGIGDQGADGMAIAIGKLALYTACAGLDPASTLPVVLDVGTNNPEKLGDPLYAGWRSPRVTGAAYVELVDAFVEAVRRRWPRVLLHFEDFAQHHATLLLERHRERLCAFNDDIQGTAAVTVAALLAACQATRRRLSDQVIAVVGAGSAGCGVSEQLVAAMKEEGLGEVEARSRFFLVDRAGLLREGQESTLLPFQRRFVQPAARLAGWKVDGAYGLEDVVRNASPTVLLGFSGQPGLFTEPAVRAMAAKVDRPIIFPLSNPTSRCEARPSDLVAWTNGRALVATGSPFDPVWWNGRALPIVQCNNAYVFPALGLGVLAAGARRVTDGMFMAAARALAATAPMLSDPGTPLLLPPLRSIRNVVRRVAHAVAQQAVKEGVAEPADPQTLAARMEARIWTPTYRPL
jgi:malate dehydrogenase (oxaloacetate-decarboxylating)